VGHECALVVLAMLERGKRTWKRLGYKRNKEAERETDTRRNRGKRDAREEVHNRRREPAHAQELALRQYSLWPEPLLLLLSPEPADVDWADVVVDDARDDGRLGDDERDEEEDAREDGGVGGGWSSTGGRQSQPGTSQWLTMYA